MGKNLPLICCTTHDPWITHSLCTMGCTTIYPIVQPMVHGVFISLYGVVWPMGHGKKVAEWAPSLSRHFLKNQMSTYLDTGAALEQHITAMRLEILEKFAETLPESLSVSDACSLRYLLHGKAGKVTLSLDRRFGILPRTEHQAATLFPSEF